MGKAHRLARLSVLLAVACALAFVVSTRGGVARIAAARVAGRSFGCGWSESLRADRETATRVKRQHSIAAHLRELARDGRLALEATQEGEYWIPSGNTQALAQHLAEQDERVYGLPRSGDIVLDCGAHIGTFTRAALRAGARLIIAIEPAPVNLECLRRNLRAEIQAGRAIVYPKGVWDRETTLTLDEDDGFTSGDTFVPDMHRSTGHPGPRVPLTSIDNLVAELALNRVDFIKMDIEGAEKQALVGARATLLRFHPRLAIAAYHVQGDAEAIPRIVGVGYHPEVRCAFFGSGIVAPEILWLY